MADMKRNTTHKRYARRTAASSGSHAAERRVAEPRTARATSADSARLASTGAVSTRSDSARWRSTSARAARTASTAGTRDGSSKRKLAAILASVCLVAALAVGGTIAFFTDTTDPVTNTFTGAKITGDVPEEFDGTIKKNVTVTNSAESDVAAYARVNLVTYMVKDVEGGGTQRTSTSVSIPAFTPGANWQQGADGYWYYLLPIEPGQSAGSYLIGAEGIELASDSETGEHQVVEVMAQFVQAPGDLDADGTPAVVDAWGGAHGSVTAVGANGLLTVTSSSSASN